MKKLIIFLLVTVLLTGCSKTTSEKDTTAQKDQTTENTTEGKNLDSLLEQYLISDIACRGENLIILLVAFNNTEISPSKIVVADSKDHRILEEIDDDNYNTNASIVTVDDGFYINRSTDFTVYDDKLKIIKQIDLDQFAIKFSTAAGAPAVSLSQDLKQMAYVNSEKNMLVLRDLETGTEKDIYQLSYSVGKIMAINQLYICDGYIGFNGEYKYAEDFEILGSNAYGRINIETNQIDMYQKDGISSLFEDDHMLLVDVMRYGDEYGTKEAIIYDVDDNHSQTVKLKSTFNSYNMDFPKSDTVISYNDVGRNTAKLLLYQNGKEKIYDDGIPKEVVEVGSCYDEKNKKLILFYTIPAGETGGKSEISEVDLS